MATITKGKTFINGELVTPASIHQLVDSATISGIVNADIAANAAIADTKLDQISTAGKVLPVAVQGTAVITTDPRLSDSRPPISHTHDERYYTEAEVNALLAAKANTTHSHAISDTSGLQAALDSKLSGSNLGLVKAWVNFNHGRMLGVTNAANGESITVTAGSSSGTWNSTTAFSTGQLGIIYYITSAGAVPNASLGGINVSTLGFQIRAISGNTATIKLLAGPAATSQTITGNGGTSGFQYMSYGIRAQNGVSSITKAASGSHMNFTFNFSTPFDFIDYFYQFQMDARSSGDFYIQTKGQSSIQIQVLNFSDASVSSQMNFMALGL